MGSSHSYVTDPNAFATEVGENDDQSHWKSYDYVIVGGGAFYGVPQWYNHLMYPQRHGGLGTCVSPLREFKRVYSLNRSREKVCVTLSWS